MKQIFQKSIIRKLSSCLIENVNGFNIVRIENERAIRKKFYPFHVVYKPIKKWAKKINCFFSTLNFHTFIQRIEVLLMMMQESNIVQHVNVTVALIFTEEKISTTGILKIALGSLIYLMCIN